MSVLPDPCPLPDKTKRRSLNDKEKLIFAPMAGVGGIVYDKVRYVCVVVFVVVVARILFFFRMLCT